LKKVSVIVPVYNVEKYLSRCLESLVNQTIKDIEVLVVNNKSTDDSQKIIDEYQKKYPDIVKPFQEEVPGAANARNKALEHASGEFIGFVDSDDYIEETMYEEMYNKAKEMDSDIVCSGYYRVIEDKKYTKMKFGNKRIKQEEVFDKNIYEQNLLFDEVPYLWNKIFKSSIIKEENIKFDNELRIYEDLLFTYQAFSKAKKISRVDKPFYYYIIQREGSLTQTLTEKRFDIFKVTEKLNDYYKKTGKYDELKEVLLYIILKHIYVILEKKTKNSEKKLKRKYINQVFEFLNKEFPNWKENMYFELQRKPVKKYTSKLYWKLCTLVGVNIVKVWPILKKKAKKGIKYIFTRKPGKVYLNQCKRNIDEKSVFVFPQQGNNLNGNMFYIVKELTKNEIYKDYTINIGYTDKKEKFETLLQSYDILERVKLIKNKTTKFAKVCAKSKYIFTDTSMPTYFIKRKEQVMLNTWHGTPLKTLGKSTENDFFDIANVQKNFVISDYLLYPNIFMKDIMIEDYMLKGIANNKIMLCGYPRNEIFLRDDKENARKNNGFEGKTIIAYMPTWRGGVRSVDVSEQIEIAQNHIKEISDNLKENQILYVNMHPFIGNKLDLSEYENVKTFPKNLETYEFLSLCDILITDYSSVFFDFCITDKKIILFAYDEEEYFRERGVYLKFEELPFRKVKTVTELINEINTPINYDARYFKERFCKYERKDISKLICEVIFQNKKNDLQIIDIPKSEKENVLIYLDNFRPDNNTKDFIKIVHNKTDTKYNNYVSYITKRLRPNKDLFKKVVNKVRFYGQLGQNQNFSKFEILLIVLLKKRRKLYELFRNKYSKMKKTELKRVFHNIKFSAVILFGSVEYKKIYLASELDAKKILYIKYPTSFNKQVNKEVYNNFDYILTTNYQCYNIIRDYCGQDKNIRIINEIKTLDDFNKYII